MVKDAFSLHNVMQTTTWPGVIHVLARSARCVCVCLREGVNGESIITVVDLPINGAAQPNTNACLPCTATVYEVQSKG